MPKLQKHHNICPYSFFQDNNKLEAHYNTYRQIWHKNQHQTFLLNLLRGTKAKGLGGIPVRRNLCTQTEIVRPLLSVSRQEVMDYLKGNGLTHITDETNFDDAFRRNWVRGTLLPLLETKQPQIRAHLAQMAEEISALFSK